MKIETAIIIAGGKGTRMRSLGEDVPNNVLNVHKSMIDILGKPLLERNIEWLKKNGIKNIIIGVAEKKEGIIDYFDDGKKFGVKIIYTEHDPDGGTADAFLTDIEKSGIDDKYFYALNSDQITDFNLNKLSEKHFSTNPIPLATIMLVYPTSPFGLVRITDDGRVVEFKEKPKLPVVSNGGIYLFDIDIKEFLSGDVERNTFVKLAQMGRLHSVIHDGFWETINTYKDFIRVKEKLSRE